jgi:hypothetical protein
MSIAHRQPIGTGLAVNFELSEASLNRLRPGAIVNDGDMHWPSYANSRQGQEVFGSHDLTSGGRVVRFHNATSSDCREKQECKTPK